MRKVKDGGNKEKNDKNIMTFIVAPNVIASQLPERQLTGMPTAALVPIEL